MNLQQLRSICAIVDSGLSLSSAAMLVHRSQSAVTRQVQDLENELGVQIFIRRQNRILRISPVGEYIVSRARIMLAEEENIKKISQETNNASEGHFTIATTHTQSRYVLPDIIKRFLSIYPKIQLNLHEGNPEQCCEFVSSGEADVAIVTDPRRLSPDVFGIPCFNISRSIVTLRDNPLPDDGSISIKDLITYPLIVYDESFSSRRIISETFSAAGYAPRVVLSAIDADVSKKYVEIGLGIAIIANVAFDPVTDSQLRLIDARHLFRHSQLSIFVSNRNYLRGYVIEFLKLFAPHADFSLIGRGGMGNQDRKRLDPPLPLL